MAFNSSAKECTISQTIANKIIAIGGAKGGVGKTILTVNLALALTEVNQSVIILDADFGSANCNTMLGIIEPTKSIEDY
ncbi:MAG: P-loop NTPase, partial [Oligoflexia bacterium]|nr:P-loop NTPase [Oligoflexia bacterium]